jgi:hypothetical protein
MKLERRYRRKPEQKFSGRVEIAITGLDETGNRMKLHSGGWRRSLRVGDTTVDEVYDIVLRAIEEHSEVNNG